MAALRYSLVLVLLLCSCAFSKQGDNIVIENNIDGCFSFTSSQLGLDNEPVILKANIGAENKNADCMCKSALFKYVAYQKNEGEINNLISGTFTTLGKSVVSFPIAVQKQLIFPKIPIHISMSCSN